MGRALGPGKERKEVALGRDLRPRERVESLAGLGRGPDQELQQERRLGRWFLCAWRVRPVKNGHPL